MLDGFRGKITEQMVFAVRTGDAAFDDLEAAGSSHGRPTRNYTPSPARNNAEFDSYACRDAMRSSLRLVQSIGRQGLRASDGSHLAV